MNNFVNRPLSRRAFVGGASAAAALGLAACGSSSTSSSSSSSSSTASTGTEGGGTIAAGSAYAPSSFNPASTGSAIGIGANWHVVEGLYGIDYHDYTTFPELATGDPTQVDDTTFEVTLRSGAAFSDGNAVTPDDVVASFNRAVAGKLYTAMLAPIASIEAKGDNAVTITTTVANFSLLKERLAIVRVCPASQTDDQLAAQPVGSGPWMYSTASDTVVELVPNEKYNGDHAAKDNMIHYDILKDATARLTAMQEGSTQVMELVSADAVDQLKSAGAKIDQVQGFGTRFMMFNVAKAPWDNVKVRQAVMYALNYDQMISNTFSGLASKPSCYLPETFTNYHKASTVYDYDVDKAKSLIKDSGITPGAISLRTTDNEQVVSMATEVKNDLDALGFTVTITTDTSAATYSAIDGGEAYDLLLAPGDPSCFGADPDLLLNWWYGDGVWMKTRCPWNTSDEWKKLHELMAQALEQSGDDQQNTWNECFDILADNVPLYPVIQIQTVTASWDDPSKAPSGTAIKGFSGIGTTSMYFLDCVSLKA